MTTNSYDMIIQRTAQANNFVLNKGNINGLKGIADAGLADSIMEAIEKIASQRGVTISPQQKSEAGTSLRDADQTLAKQQLQKQLQQQQAAIAQGNLTYFAEQAGANQEAANIQAEAAQASQTENQSAMKS